MAADEVAAGAAETNDVGGDALAEVKAELFAKGYRWHFLGIPHNRRGEAWDHEPDRYWLNGATLGEGRGRLTKQPFGWFTLDELRAEKFAEGLHVEAEPAASPDTVCSVHGTTWLVDGVCMWQTSSTPGRCPRPMVPATSEVSDGD